LLLEIRARAPDAVLLGGDIAQATTLRYELCNLAEDLGRPIYFVLGNHDYYKGSIAGVRRIAAELTREFPLLHWLPVTGVVRLTDETSLVGHDGWGDARAGDFDASEVVLNDYLLIQELREAWLGTDPARSVVPDIRTILSASLKERLRALGDEAAAHFRRLLPEALAVSRHVYVLMHVPPFLAACWHQGRTSDANWSPHFTCQAAGEALVELMRRHPEKQMTVLCGHTHSPGTAQVLDNLVVLTGGADYGEPRVQQTFEA
jgi:3',5'-cyclic AMP phosphodiesterase CpdA